MIEIRPQTIHSPSGDELVVLTRAEYDALSSAAAATLEEADDIAIFDARVADLTAGRDARLPPEVTTAMLRGDSLLRALRRWKGMKQLDLALGAKLVQGYVSDLESGRKGGTPRPFAPSQERSTSIPPGSALELSASLPGFPPPTGSDDGMRVESGREIGAPSPEPASPLFMRI